MYECMNLCIYCSILCVFFRSPFFFFLPEACYPLDYEPKKLKKVSVHLFMQHCYCCLQVTIVDKHIRSK